MRALSLVPLLVLLGGSPAAAQAPVPFTRADLQGTVGWYNIRSPQPAGDFYGSDNDWMNAIGQADAAGGWFWTEHLRTSVDFGVNSTGRQYQYGPAFVNGQQVYQSRHIGLRQWQVGIGQQYQFGHNAWFHPHAGGGVLIAFQHRTIEADPAYYYDQATRTSRTIGSYTIEARDETIVRPFVDAGFKAYVSRHVYFVHDTRFVAGGHGLEQLGFKFGFGVDFW